MTIINEIKSTDKVLLYPSSCHYHHEFENIPYDVIILCSNAFSSSRKKGKVYCVKSDNNALLVDLYNLNIKISSLVIIRDGCQEGGNYECVAKNAFMGRILPLMMDTFEYICDHPFQLDLPAEYNDLELPKYLNSIISYSQPIGPIQAFRVTKIHSPIKSYTLGNIKLNIYWDSIWNCFGDCDAIYINHDFNHFTSAFLNETKYRTAIKNVPRILPEKHIQPILDDAKSNKYSEISLMPLGKHLYRPYSYVNVLQEIKKWEDDYPRVVNLYHLNRNDFFNTEILIRN